MSNIIPRTQINKIPSSLKDKKTVLVGGCFDILHIGHITFLEKAKSKADILIVLLESDDRIRKLKGQGRPINTQSIRAKILSTLKSVDFIILLSKNMKNEDYDVIVQKIKPKIIATTSGDPNLNFKKRTAKLVGAKVLAVTNKISDHSTTKLWKLLKEI